MRSFFGCLAVMTTILSAPSNVHAGTLTRSSAYILIGLAAEATALSEFCVNYQVDSVAVRRFLGIHDIRIAGQNRAVFGAAYGRVHANARRGVDFPDACFKGLDLYGPQGRHVAGLVRPVWNGACGDCQIGNPAAQAAARAAAPF